VIPPDVPQCVSEASPVAALCLAKITAWSIVKRCHSKLNTIDKMERKSVKGRE